MKNEGFRIFIHPLSPKESGGRWDFSVLVRRDSDGAMKQELASGGMGTAEAVARRLLREITEEAAAARSFESAAAPGPKKLFEPAA